jgi:hypothetical protein
MLARRARHDIAWIASNRDAPSRIAAVCWGMALLHDEFPDELPDIDDRLVAPNTRYEILDGVVEYVSPADIPHGVRHAQILLLIGAHVGLEFQVACDLLSRVTRIDDFAPDVSVFPVAPDPRTGGRQLDQLAFEVVNKKSMARTARKATKLVARGVRRVFAIDLDRSRALEWSRADDDWCELQDVIEDPVFDVPLPVDALIRTLKTDDLTARALLAKHNPVLEATRAHDRAEGRAEGRIAGKREALIALLAARGLPLDDAARERIAHEQDAERLDRWIAGSLQCATVAELLANR